MNWQEHLCYEQQARRRVDFKMIHVDMAGDLIAGLMLSQLIYWYLPDQKGNSKLRVNWGGADWIVKADKDWWEECRISRRQAQRAKQTLVEKELIECQIARFGGVPTTHIRILKEKYMERFNEIAFSDCTPRCNRLHPQVQSDCTPRCNPSEITQRLLQSDTASPPSVSPPDSSLRKKKKTPAAEEVGEEKRVTSKHPAIAVFRGAAHRYPAKAWYREIAEAVGEREEDVERWRALVHDWVGRGWNPTNVKGMLEKYRKENPNVVDAAPPRVVHVTRRDVEGQFYGGP